MNNKVFLVLFVLAIGVFAGCASEAPSQDQLPDEPENTEDNQQVPDQEQPDEGMQETPEQETQTTEPDVTLQFTGENFVYYVNGEENPTITVQEGDLVRVEYETASGFHDWVIDEFGATEQVGADAGVQVLEFVADETGEFEYYCSVGSHRQQGMFGTLIVE